MKESKITIRERDCLIVMDLFGVGEWGGGWGGLLLLLLF